MRAGVVVLLGVLASACKKPPPPPPPPPTAADLAVSKARADVELLWMLTGRCQHNVVGAFDGGTYVQAHLSDLCTHIKTFTPAGALRDDIACCEGTCRPRDPPMGKPTRDLCEEAHALLSEGPLWMAIWHPVKVTRDGDDVVPPYAERRWALKSGRYRVTGRGAPLEFEIDGRRVRALGDLEVSRTKDGLCTLGDASFFPCEP